MKLLIDMGNSAIKWASLKQKRLSAQQAIPNDKLDNLLTQAWLKLDVPSQGIWISILKSKVIHLNPPLVPRGFALIICESTKGR
ncbi:hypothetical protein PN36_04075 [Candidatus Thiomargarita nelsonii]|uniref:Pantothenate kinase n=1 Tax=Candidatus Thiomargarita nelsonii TaxID=1003181 RepID=A0A0A6PBK8_9GAMM|nr:hypothetical protein PN36_04075 [Candidatus Thiomargarita nelsonii]